MLVLSLLACSSEEDVDPDASRYDHYDEPTATPVDVDLQVDRYQQADGRPHDVLFVVDNSFSMEDEQLLLADAFPDFGWEGLEDWRVGVISTDMTDPEHSGSLREVDGERWFAHDDPAAHDLFARRVVMDGASTRHEGLAATLAAFDHPANDGFFRDDAVLYLVFVSDDDDDSPISFEQFRDGLTDRYYVEDIVITAVVGPPGHSCAIRAGESYMAAVDAFRGVKWNVCHPDVARAFEGTLDEVSLLRLVWPLSRLPAVDSLRVELDGERVGNAGYEYDAESNAVLFDPILEAGTVVEIFYELP